MSGVNRVIIIGNLGADPELKQTTSGAPVVNLSVATSESWKDKEGEEQSRTEWTRIVIFGKTAEVAAKYLKKGSLAYFEGRLQTRSWDDKETGVKKYSTEVIASAMQMLGGKSDSIEKDSQEDFLGPAESPAALTAKPHNYAPGAEDAAF